MSPPRPGKETFGCVLILVTCIYFICQASALTEEQPSGPMALGGGIAAIIFVFTILPMIAIWVTGHVLTRAVPRFRQIAYFAAAAFVLLVIRQNLAGAPPYPSDYYYRGTPVTIAAIFKSIAAPPGTTDQEPGNYFPASEDNVVLFLAISLLFLGLASWDTRRIFRQRRRAEVN